MQEQELFPEQVTEREVVLDEPELHDEQADALRAATDRAERAEAELAKLKNAAAHKPTPAAHDRPAAHTATAHAAPRGSDTALKSPPSPSTREAQANTPHASTSNDAVNQDEISADAETGSDPSAISELRNDSMMAHLLDSLEAGKDIGHYGRLVFSMVARHFLPHEEVLAWLTRDPDFSEEQANLMLRQVEGRDYNPPRRDRILEWQSQQDFPIIPNPDDPDSGNLYRNLKFPDEIYQHIGHYQEKKLESEAEPVTQSEEVQRF